MGGAGDAEAPNDHVAVLVSDRVVDSPAVAEADEELVLVADAELVVDSVADALVEADSTDDSVRSDVVDRLAEPVRV